MPTTCPNCGAGSPATADSCSSCGRELYRLKEPVTQASFRISLGISRVWMLVTASLMIVLVGAGVATAFILGFGADNDTERRAEPSGPTVTPTPTRSATPSATPSSPEPTRKPPHKPPPTSHQPHPSPPPRAEPTPRSLADEIIDDVNRQLRENGTGFDPYADPTDGGNWHVDRNGNISVSP